MCHVSFYSPGISQVRSASDFSGSSSSWPWQKVQMQVPPNNKNWNSHVHTPWNKLKTSWWLNQPIWKICSSNWIISPNRDENRKYLKPPPRKSYCETFFFEKSFDITTAKEFKKVRFWTSKETHWLVHWGENKRRWLTTIWFSQDLWRTKLLRRQLPSILMA